MIYLICLKKDLNFYNNYINSILYAYNNIKLVIKNSREEVYSLMNNYNSDIQYIFIEEVSFSIPYQVNFNEIYDLEKKYDYIAIKNEKTKYLFQHKILIDKNDEPNIDINKYIFNKNIIVTDNKYLLDKYIIKCKPSNNSKIIEFLLKNYEVVYDKIFDKFNIYKCQENLKNIGLKVINDSFGFIILRCVTSETTNKYWQECYKCIRKYYNNKIIIIDDNSDKDFLNDGDIHLTNCYIENSEFHSRGEILPYYYFYKNHYFEKAIIIQDSVFINKYINFNNKDDSIKFIWHFTHDWDNEEEDKKYFKYLSNSDILKKFYNTKNMWEGCFGCQSIIKYDFLKKIVEKYNMFELLDYIDNREKRMSFERIFGLICNIEDKELINNISLFGKIHHYIHWGFTYEKYLNEDIDRYELIKVWTGR